MSSEPDLEAQPGEQKCVTKSFSFVKDHVALTLTLVVAVATGAVFVAKVSVSDDDSQQQFDVATSAGEMLSLIMGAVTAMAESSSRSGARQAAMQAFQAPAVNVEGDDPVVDGESYYDYIARWFNRAESEE